MRKLIKSILIVIALGICGVIFVVLPIVKVLTYPTVFSYQQGKCTITSKELKLVSRGRGKSKSGYAAHFEYDVQTAEGDRFHSNRYDWFDGTGWFGYLLEFGNKDSKVEQAIVDHYQIGQSYSCWYNENRQAILTRDFNLPRLIGSNSLFLIGAFIGILVLFSIITRLLHGKPQRTTVQPQPYNNQANRYY